MRVPRECFRILVHVSGDWSETNSTGYYLAANEKDVFFFNVKIENVSKDDLTLDSQVLHLTNVPIYMYIYIHHNFRRAPNKFE